MINKKDKSAAFDDYEHDQDRLESVFAKPKKFHGGRLIVDGGRRNFGRDD